jgi:hypothetical protein
MSTQNLTQKPQARNGQSTIEARAFAMVFIPVTTQPNITQRWSLKASEAIQTLIYFHSSVHRWQAVGRVDNTEFAREVQHLKDCGLACWLDELIVRAIMEVTR